MRWEEKPLEEWARDLLKECPDMRGTPTMTEAQEEDSFRLRVQLAEREYTRVVSARLRRLEHIGALPPEAESRLVRVWQRHVERCLRLFRDAAPGRARRRARFYDPI